MTSMLVAHQHILADDHQAGAREEQPFYLSMMPDAEASQALLRGRLRRALERTEGLDLGKRRAFYQTLRNSEESIVPEMIYTRLGMTVGELAVTQLCFATDRFNPKRK